MPVSETVVASQAQNRSGFAETCYLCGSFTFFASQQGNFREAQCARCGSTKRVSDVARSISAAYGPPSDDPLPLPAVLNSLRHLRIFEAAASGPIHNILAALPGYTCAEFLDHVEPGQSRNGVRCEDLTRLTFPDSSFDLVITQDVFEHIIDFEGAFAEMFRVLKPSGRHVFTVPVNMSHPTRRRVNASGEGNLKNLLPPVYHGDPLRSSGAIVAVDFGMDLSSLVEKFGFATSVVDGGQWYGPEEVTWIDDEEKYTEYRQVVNEQGMLAYFRYNSMVFVSEKLALPFTGERFVPELKGQIAHEHFHRYALAREFVRGKTVLDIASGEGYGSFLLAAEAKLVTGVDVSEESIRHAQRKYARQDNLRFLTGTCQQIPCPDESFDVVVSFETIEHIEDQGQFLREVERVLKKDGVFVMSSPNTEVYNSGAKDQNPFHKHELEVGELQSLIRRHFSHVHLYGQRLTLGSQVWPMEERPEATWKVYSKEGAKIEGNTTESLAPEYFIALCSRASLEYIPGASGFRDGSNDLTNDYHARGVWGQSLDNELRQVKAELAKLKNGGNGNPSVRSDKRQLAKAHIREHRWKPAVDILQSLIAQDPSDIAAVLDLASICVRRRELETCSTLVNHVLALDPGNRGAMDILRQLSIRETSRRNTELPFEISRCHSLDEYELHCRTRRDSQINDADLKGQLQKVGDGFGIEGHCYVCDDDVVFRVESAQHDEHGVPDAVNWRETLVCPQCGLTNRTRAAVHLFEMLLHPPERSSIYLAEQTTPFYREIVNRYRNVIGSEFFGPQVQPGTTDRNGLRHEDFTRLSFQGASLDFVLSFDVFEHVPEYERAFKECFRVLKPGGSLFFSVPFERTVHQTQIRAVCHPDGSIEHIQPPEYHGDPIHPGGGCLCYQIFGWDVLQLIERIGFTTAAAILYESRQFGYVGGTQIIFLAAKPLFDNRVATR